LVGNDTYSSLSKVSDDDQVQDGVEINIDDPKKSGNDTDREGRLSYRTGYTG